MCPASHTRHQSPPMMLGSWSCGHATRDQRQGRLRLQAVGGGVKGNELLAMRPS